MYGMIFHDNAFNLLYSCIVNKHEKTFFLNINIDSPSATNALQYFCT